MVVEIKEDGGFCVIVLCDICNEEFVKEVIKSIVE